MDNIIIFAEKPDIGTRLAATLGGCMIGTTELKPEMLSDKKYESLIKKERFTKGHFTAEHKGQKYVITWGFGHIAELKQAKDYDAKYQRWTESLFPFIPAEYEIRLKEDGNIKKHFELIKGLFNDKKTSFIINATDADREGELIFDYAYRLSGTKKPYKRLWINSYTEEAILQGFASLKEEKDILSLQQAGRSRAIADWLVGANLTAVGTIKFGGYQNMVSIGRVQTPTLAMLVNRENEIVRFKPETYFEIHGTFETPAGEKYKGKWKRGKTDRFTKKSEAENILKSVDGKNGTVTKLEQTESFEKPPLLYDLTTLQMDCNAKFAFSAQQTLDVAQKLYEKQFITYPRTNSRFLSESLKGEITRILQALPAEYKQFLSLLPGKLPFSKRIFDDKKVESHYAIIPTYKTPAGLSPDEEKIYSLIAKSLLKVFLPDAKWGNTKIETTAEKEIFFTSGKTLIEAGWRIIDGKNAPQEDEEKEEILPHVHQGMDVKGVKYEIVQKKTKPPVRYTEKTILSAMETAGKLVEDDDLREAMKDHGLGTPATRAATIERLINVGYVKREKKNLVPTEKGIQLIQVFPVDEIKSPFMTGEWEFKLKKIEKGQMDDKLFRTEIEEFTRQMIDKLKSFKRANEAARTVQDKAELGKCPNCSSSVIKNSKGWGCSSWRNGCKFQIWDTAICGVKLKDNNVKQLLKKGETQTIKGFISKNNKEFSASLMLDKEGKLKFKF